MTTPLHIGRGDNPYALGPIEKGSVATPFDMIREAGQRHDLKAALEIKARNNLRLMETMEAYAMGQRTPKKKYA